LWPKEEKERVEKEESGRKKFKLKTHKATAKRFKLTGSGKVMQTKGRQSHFRRRVSKRAKRQFSKMLEVKVAKNRQSIKRLAPYLNKFNTKGH